VPGSDGLDVVLTTVLANRLDSICREMGGAMLRSARSSIFAENRDFATAIFDATPRMVAQTAYIPILLGSTPWAVQAVSDFFGDDVADGDVMIFNDPYLGNNHLPDITVLRPVFRDGRVRFWMVTRGHHADIGGGGAGGYNPDARTAFEEGIRITPSKLYQAGRYNKALWRMILANVRLPSLVEGDLQCQVGATKIGERSIHAVLDRYGDETVGAAIEETVARSEAQTAPTGPNGGSIASAVARNHIPRSGWPSRSPATSCTSTSPGATPRSQPSTTGPWRTPTPRASTRSSARSIRVSA
jgi:N-methylhydantoinase B